MKFAVLALLVASTQAADPVCVKSVTTYTDAKCTADATALAADKVTELNTAQVTVHKAACTKTADSKNSFKYECSATGGASTVYAGDKCEGKALEGDALKAVTVPQPNWTTDTCMGMDGKYAKITTGIAKVVAKNNTSNNTTKKDTNKTNTTKTNTSNSTNNSSGAQALAATFAASAALLATVY